MFTTYQLVQVLATIHLQISREDGHAILMDSREGPAFMERRGRFLLRPKTIGMRSLRLGYKLCDIVRYCFSLLLLVILSYCWRLLVRIMVVTRLIISIGLSTVVINLQWQITMILFLLLFNVLFVGMTSMVAVIVITIVVYS